MIQPGKGYIIVTLQDEQQLVTESGLYVAQQEVQQNYMRQSLVQSSDPDSPIKPGSTVWHIEAPVPLSPISPLHVMMEKNVLAYLLPDAELPEAKSEGTSVN